MRVTRKSVVSGNPRTLGDRLLKARVEAGLTQRQLEARCGVSNAHVSQIEQGKMHLTVKIAVKLANALGLSLDYLCRGWTIDKTEKFVDRARIAAHRARRPLRVVGRARAATQW